jgi:hypothetical protein
LDADVSFDVLVVSSESLFAWVMYLAAATVGGSFARATELSNIERAGGLNISERLVTVIQ